MTDIVRAIAALVLVSGIFVGCALGLQWLARRVRQPMKAGPVILGTTWLDARRRLVAVRWGEHDYLLSLGPGGERLIASQPAMPNQPDDPSCPR